MAANANAPAQNGTNANGRDRDQHVEFVVKAAEDLILEGSERSIPRVRAGAPYSCLMLKNQRFSSLFRHYAKHHGLRKDDLAYFFTEELQNEDTPESVFLQGRDEIIVRKRRPAMQDEEDEEDVDLDRVCPNEVFMKQIAKLEKDEEHTDVTFFVGPTKTPLRAHKAVLVARSEYFASTLRKGTFLEGKTCEIYVESHQEPVIKRMLEFIYTNRVAGLHRSSAEDFTALLEVAEQYLLSDLKQLCEHTAKSIIDAGNVAKLLSAADQVEAPMLRAACMKYIRDHLDTVSKNKEFEAEMSVNPRLSVLIFKSLAQMNATLGQDQGAGTGPGSAGRRPAKRRRVGTGSASDFASDVVGDNEDGAV